LQLLDSYPVPCWFSLNIFISSKKLLVASLASAQFSTWPKKKSFSRFTYPKVGYLIAGGFITVQSF
jgi:hypothetical protein